MALEGQDLLALLLGDLQLAADHLRLRLLVSHRAWWIGIVAERRVSEVIFAFGAFVTITVMKDLMCPRQHEKQIS